MGFTGPGPGRPKGSISKGTVHFQEVLKARGFDIAEAFLDIRDEAAKFFLANKTDPIGGPQALKILLDVTNDIASYVLPKLKSIEVTAKNPLEGMTTRQKLETMREAVALLEAEVSNEEAMPMIEVGE